jgi:hypothetical protein
MRLQTSDCESLRTPLEHDLCSIPLGMPSMACIDADFTAVFPNGRAPEKGVWR